jgi:uracil-DNA glycosylase
MDQKLDYEEFVPLLGSWAELFKEFIEGKEMWDIYQKLKEDGKKEVIVPTSENTFRAFGTSHPQNIKSVWYLMDPYPKMYKGRIPQATGIAMDCSNSPDGRLQPSLEIFYDAISKDIGHDVFRSADLGYLHDQGVMLLNTDLTCKLNKTGSHKKLWEPFHKFFLEEIMSQKTGIIYVLAGKDSHRMERYIMPINNYVIKLEHPVASAYTHTEWDAKKVFTRTNQLLKENGKSPIYWNKGEYEQSLPF